MDEKILHQILEELKHIKSEFVDFKIEQKKANERLSKMETDIPQLKQSVGDIPKIKQTVGDIPKIKQTVGDIPDIKQAVGDIPDIKQAVGDIPQIKQAVLETLERVNRLEKTQDILIKGQERQDKILESLALRSLEQETELRDLKRIK